MFAFAVGASVGSFLNVVAYRMPQGINLAYPPSRCPMCETPIKPWHNIPVLSWLALRGRCRYCGTGISSRYFLVELTTGLIFLGLMLIEVRTGGANLPFRQVSEGGLVELVRTGQWELFGLFAYHATALSVLLAMTLIVSDGHSVPRRLLSYGLLLGIIPATIWPDLRPVHWSVSPSVLPEGVTGLLDGVAGVAAGTAIGLLMGKAGKGMVPAMAIVGAFLGWQAGLSVGLIAAIALVPFTIGSRTMQLRRPIPPVALLLVATLLHLASWRGLLQNPWWPGPSAHRSGIVAHLFCIVPLVFAAQLIGGSSSSG